MNKIIKLITDELQDDIVSYEAILKESLKSNVKLINVVINYAIKRKGKQFRPLLCILCSRLNGRNPNEATFLSAATVEILHVATLLHDDVIDDAYIRRAWPSVNKIWKNKLSILIGDYMFSKSLNNISKLDKIENIKLLANISDRFINNYVLDFIYFHYNQYYWPAFNFADIYISIGIVIIIIQSFKIFQTRIKDNNE